MLDQLEDIVQLSRIEEENECGRFFVQDAADTGRA